MRLQIGELESLRIIKPVRQGGNYLILISTAFRFIDRLIRIRMLISSVMTAATAACMLCFTMIGRMNGFTGHILQECNDEATVTGTTCMYIEPYDTQRVPYKHNYC